MLLEAIAAAGIVALGLVAFLSGLPTAATAVSEGAQLSTATFLATSRLEEVRRLAWSGVALDGSTFPDEPVLAGLYAGYSRQVRIVECSAPPGCGSITSPQIRQITVTVGYRPVAASGLAADSKAVSLTTLITAR
jgi:hypothetical protein